MRWTLVYREAEEMQKGQNGPKLQGNPSSDFSDLLQISQEDRWVAVETWLENSEKRSWTAPDDISYVPATQDVDRNLGMTRNIPFHHYDFEDGEDNHKVSWVSFAFDEMDDGHQRLISHGFQHLPMI